MDDDLSRPRSLLARAASYWKLACASLLVAACGGQGASDGQLATTIDLLARKPDRIFEQTGRLEPGPRDEWEEFGLGGWFARTLPATATSPSAVALNRPEARLLLLASEPVERVLRFSAWIPELGLGDLLPPRDSASPGVFYLSLNGIALTEDGLSALTTPQTFEVIAPEAAWHLGENVLEFRVLPFKGSNGAGTTFDHLAVAALDYGPRLSVTEADGKLVLLPETGLRYDLEPLGTPRLRIEGSAVGEGELELRYATVDPATGAQDGGAFQPHALPVAAGDVRLELPIPRRDDQVLRLEILWRSADEAARFELTALRLEACEPTPRPPVIFISIDTFSARHLASYGYARQTTPNLDALLDEAVLFERCVANAPWTTPSYLSVLSGLFPRAHQIDPEGLGGASLLDQWQLAANRWTMAEALRARGYATAGFVDTVWLDERFRVDQGFDLWDDSAATLPFEHPAYGVAYVTEKARRWLATLPPEQTPFLFLHALDAHGPYLPELPFLGTFQNDLPEPRRRALAGADYQAAGAVPEWMARTVLHSIQMRTPEEMAGAEIPREVDVDPIIACYDESLLKVDAFVGRFLDAVRAQGLWDEAVVIVTGDHGEAFDEEYYGHARLYEEVLEVPLIVKFPRALGAGKRIATGVQLVDLYPTLMELSSGRAAPSWVHGRSLLPLVRAGEGETTPLFSEGGHFEAYTVILEDWKLIESYPSRESGAAALISHPRVPRTFLEEHFPAVVDEALTAELLKSLAAEADFDQRIKELRALLAQSEPYLHLFDLSVDPDETNDVADANPAKVGELLQLLEELKTRSREAQATAVKGIATQDLSEEQLDELRALGYIGQDR